MARLARCCRRAASMLRAMELNGAAAIVSGGASGLGEAMARGSPRQAVAAVVADLNEEQGNAVAAETGGVFVRTDVADEHSVQAAVDAAGGPGVPLRVAVSCAGIGWAARTVGRDGTPHDLAAYRKVIDVNLIGTFNLMRIAAAAIAKTAGRRGRAAWRDHQHLVSRRPRGADRPGRLLRFQGRHHRHDRACRPRPRRDRRPGQHHLSWHHRHAHLRLRRRPARSSRPSSPRRWSSRSGWAPPPSSLTWSGR